MRATVTALIALAAVDLKEAVKFSETRVFFYRRLMGSSDRIRSTVIAICSLELT
jgi:hypothetical protein